MPRNYIQLEGKPRLLISSPPGSSDEEKERLYFEELRRRGEISERSLARTATGLGTEVVLGEGIKLGGAAAGSALGPLGFLAGYVTGGIIGGVSGSLARQRISDPNAPISYGQILGDTLINLLPGVGRAGKAIGIGARVARHGAAGAVIAPAAVTVESIVDQGRLPDQETILNAGITGVALGSGLGISGELASKIYSKYANKSIAQVDADLAKKGKDAQELKAGIKAVDDRNVDFSASTGEQNLLKIKQQSVDRRSWLLSLQEKLEKTLDIKFNGSASDAYLQGRMADAKTRVEYTTLLETIRADGIALEKAAKDMAKGPKAYSAEQLHDEANRYMHAEHALEYHRKIGETGDEAAFSGGIAGGDTLMTNKEATRIVNDFKAKGLDVTLKDSLAARRLMADNIPRILKDGGLITESDYQRLISTYDHYVPLNRRPDDLTKTPAQVVEAEKQKAKGEATQRPRMHEGGGGEVNVWENLVARTEDAIYRSAKNKESGATKRLLEFAEGKTKLDLSKRVTNLSEVATVSERDYIGVDWNENLIPSPLKNDEVRVIEEGKQYIIKFQPGPFQQIAQTLKGMDRVELGSVARGMLFGNQALGTLYTRAAPAFWVPNMVRDRLESFINTGARLGYRNSLEILNPFAIARDMRTVLRNATGGGWFSGSITDPANISQDKLFKGYKGSGASVGGLGYSTKKDIIDHMGDVAPSSPLTAKVKRNKLSKLLDTINAVFENTTRFSVWKKATKELDARTDLTSKQKETLATIFSLDASFDPHLGGTMKRNMSAWFIFSNPAIQGARNMFRTLSDPKVLASTTASFVGTSMLLDWWNSNIDPDWKNKIKGGPDRSAWRLNKHLIILSPDENEGGELNYVQIPVPYPLIPIKTVSDFISDLARGRDLDPVKLAKGVADSIVEGYSPTGGSLVPTLLEKAWVSPFLSNKDGLGRSIIPPYMFEMNIPDSEKYGPWMAETVGGKLAIDIAQEASHLGMEVSPETLEYIYENSLGGLGTTMKKLVNATANLFSGKPVRNNELPILRRFLGRTYADGFEQLTGVAPDISHFEREQNTSSVQNQRRHFELLGELRKGRDAEERASIYYSLIQGENKSVQRRMKKSMMDMRMGITKTDQDVRRLGVENGQRAAFFTEQIKKMPPGDVREYIMDQSRKKIMTPEVKIQMRLLGAL